MGDNDDPDRDGPGPMDQPEEEDPMVRKMTEKTQD